ncbi:hypothetical protein AMELA_G00213280 [Ameiurus melas]|uniref:Uncharacterized protein n=1 Tax=Ameiurus melas TaxID=219545 RepID=A0A7J6A320_AMEME|nr:hypothetical protein AMELA_G00213280 [Ameiurus melas]
MYLGLINNTHTKELKIENGSRRLTKRTDSKRRYISVKTGTCTFRSKSRFANVSRFVHYWRRIRGAGS